MSRAVAALLCVIGLRPALGGDAYAYDCASGYRHWKALWPPDKQKWCCAYVQRGCTGDRRPEELFDCADDVTTFRLSWSPQKKDWCCENSQAWSNSHQRFCCERKKGCRTHSNGLPFMCNEGLDKAATGWSENKKKWCCQHENKGCPNFATTTEPFDCHAGLALASVGWSKVKTKYCCHTHNLGCKSQNCAKDFHNRRHWPKAKVCYCCRHEGIACPPVRYPPYLPSHYFVCPGVASGLPRLYEAGKAAEDDDTNKAGPLHSVGALAAGGVLALSFGIFTLVAVRKGWRNTCRRRGYTSVSMPEMAAEAPLACEEAKEERVEESS